MESTDIGSLQLLVSSEAMTVKRSQELRSVFFWKYDSEVSVSGLFKIRHSEESVGFVEGKANRFTINKYFGSFSRNVGKSAFE
jgi:hypothetical protein